MAEAKPYGIPKQLVWEAYQRVKANRGGAGVDGQSLAAFEKDLKGNLYKIWNRMSSGSYLPPPGIEPGSRGFSVPVIAGGGMC
jgi:retron-type reverse transcriptase